MAKQHSGCLICGNDLVYLEQVETQTCFFCGEQVGSNARCTQGHFVCDACHSADAEEIIERFCLETGQTDPLEMAITLMHHPSVAMHGPEHHFLVPAVLLSAYYNLQENGEKASKMKQARKRAANVPGGSCGQCGNCGAGVGTGIFISLITGATPLSARAWQLSNRMTAESLLMIADHGGPRCCKRDTFLALQSADRFLRKHFEVSFSLQEPIRCAFYPSNRECLREGCPFYAGS